MGVPDLEGATYCVQSIVAINARNKYAMLSESCKSGFHSGLCKKSMRIGQLINVTPAIRPGLN
jgi:hypothetical protein